MANIAPERFFDRLEPEHRENIYKIAIAQAAIEASTRPENLENISASRRAMADKYIHATIKKLAAAGAKADAIQRFSEGGELTPDEKRILSEQIALLQQESAQDLQHTVKELKELQQKLLADTPPASIAAISLPQLASRLNAPHQEWIYKIAAYQSAIDAHTGAIENNPENINNRRKEITNALLNNFIDELVAGGISPDAIARFAQGLPEKALRNGEPSIYFQIAQLEQKPFYVMKDAREKWNAIKKAGTNVADPFQAVDALPISPAYLRAIDAMVDWQIRAMKAQGAFRMKSGSAPPCAKNTWRALPFPARITSAP